MSFGAICAFNGGEPQGVGSTCSEVECEPEFTCGDPDAPDCCTASPEADPACNDAACCNAVCELMPGCCTNWFQGCAELANEICDHCNAPQTDACCFPDGTCADLFGDDCVAMGGEPIVGGDSSCETVDCATTFPACSNSDVNCCGINESVPGCSTVSCCNAVCSIDPTCCSDGWGLQCEDMAEAICSVCTVDEGACCFNNGSCVTVVGQECVAMGGEFQGQGTDCETFQCDFTLCGDAGAGDCCQDNGTSSCNDEACCEAVCVNLPSCCEDVWDLSCAFGASFSCDICGAPDQACCMPDGSCENIAYSQCLDMGGEPQGIPGDDITCDMVECGPTMCGDDDAGSCCEPNGTPACSTGNCCEAICGEDPFCCNTEWDSSCSGAAEFFCAVCGASPRACCLPDGSCTNLSIANCIAQGGDFQGDPQDEGPSCDSISCPQPRACCLPDGSCMDLTVDDCLGQGGAPQSSSTQCATTSCPVQPMTQACCLPNGACLNLTPADCATADGVPQGEQTTCDSTTCTTSPTCDGDINGDSTVDGADLGLLLGAFGDCPE